MRCAALIIAAVLLTTGPSRAAQPRIASMNVCTDQLLLSLADPGQIVGLSRYARDDWQSWRAADARKFPVLSGGAEDILVLRPEVVVASLFDKRATRELLRANGVQLAEFSVPRTVDEVKAQILRMGEIADQAKRANAEIARIDAAVRHARETLGQRNDRVLPLSRRGWVAGRDSLLGVVLREAGLRNAADELDIADGAFISLEGILALKPDILLLSEAGDRAEDEGRAFLLHPALARFYPPDQRVVIPDRLTVCGGVMLAEALDLLVSEMKRIGR
ncbi:ABC transporter substrate-binding protein [Bradyrhizobium manausense]|uniref:ABC transporter substrate-binding protein n=1 Tax=Bradyrhizobium TaxID=374 RepID=UPI001BA726E5|nr:MULTISPECIES: ABC transporter substrate-binding protein [Bradyrhizobium]MBR0829273.1 ABC transporter substrate-binding protein [Bradyrhizobium manausense]UVO29804.1 ABC transporter substrate-binding protein [Bradyrhizobium arachidis]